MEKKYQIILMILFFVFLTFISFLFSPFFHIRDFIFHSRNEINKNELRANINKFYGKNLLFLNENELKKSLLEHNLISSVQIEKSFPSAIHVVIEERRAVAWLKNNNKKLIFSADGIILDEKKLDNDLQVPHFEGFPYYFEEEKIEFKNPAFTEEEIGFLVSLDSVVAQKLENNETILLYTMDAIKTISSLFIFLEKIKKPIKNLNLRRPTLEDLFVKLTGNEIRD